ncbi:hypothetical protein GF361_00485 [Candidatus Woesearchaeota archaeon]|nr:hypothetical protein [Candidatus Woesearchaeota archaeon]
MAKAKRKTVKTGVKKTWYKVTAPKLFNSQVIGELYIENPSQAVGKKVPVNLTELTRDMRQQNINVFFKVNKVSGSKLYTEFVGFEMVPSSLKRMVRRGKRKVDYSFKAETKDGYNLRIKVIMVTIKLTNLSALSGLRKECEKNIKTMLKKMSYDRFIADLVNHRIQSKLRKILSKIYPLKICEIREMKVLSKGKGPKTEKKQRKKSD